VTPISNEREFYGESVVLDLLITWLEYGSRLNSFAQSQHMYVSLTAALNGLSASTAITTIMLERASRPITGAHVDE
jgi:hypothetical protein